jgi:serine/threonine protein kinase
MSKKRPVKTIAGFQLEKVLGKGGMGAVYRATHPRTGAKVAIKVILANLQEREEVKERFRREVRAMTLVEHPNLVRILEAGEADGHSYYVMQLVDGVDLATYIKKKGAFKISLVEGIATGIFSALAALHDAGVLHRDLKPHNVMLDRSGQPLIMDLGLTRVRDMKTMTRTGALIGSPRYMPPELLEGKPLDSRSDLYQAGLILWECTVGSTAVTGENFQEVSTRILTGDIPSVQEKRPEVPARLADVIETCLEVNPEFRFPSGHQAVDILEGRLNIEDLRQDLDASAELKKVEQAKQDPRNARALNQGPPKDPKISRPPLGSVFRTRVLPIFLICFSLLLGFYLAQPSPVIDPTNLLVQSGLDRVTVSWNEAKGTHLQLVVKDRSGNTWTAPENGPKTIPPLPNGRCQLSLDGLPPQSKLEVFLSYSGKRTLPRSFETPPRLIREGFPRFIGLPGGQPGLLLELHLKAALRVAYPKKSGGVTWIDSPAQTTHILAPKDLDLRREGSRIRIHAQDAAGGKLEISFTLLSLLRQAEFDLSKALRQARSQDILSQLRRLDPRTDRKHAERLLVDSDLERAISDFQPLAVAFFHSREIEKEDRLRALAAIEAFRILEHGFLALGVQATPSPGKLLQGNYFRGKRGTWRGRPIQIKGVSLIPESLPSLGHPGKVRKKIELKIPPFPSPPPSKLQLVLLGEPPNDPKGSYLKVSIPEGPTFHCFFRSPSGKNGKTFSFHRQMDPRDVPNRGGKIEITLHGILIPPLGTYDPTYYWIAQPR